jgi:hypothetical protein
VSAPVEARGLVKRHGHVVAADNVDLTVDRADAYGFLGPNGAGKTTTLVAYRWEVRKLLSQKRTYIGIAAAALLPIVFVTVMALQTGGPYDGPLGHSAASIVGALV